MKEFKKGDKVRVLDFKHHSRGVSPYSHYWDSAMDKHIGKIYEIKRTSVRSVEGYIIYNLKHANWGWAGEWLEKVEDDDDIIDFEIEELFEI